MSAFSISLKEAIRLKAAALAGVYLVLNLLLSYVGNWLVRAFVIQPAVWGFLAYLSLRLPKGHPPTPLRLRGEVVLFAGVSGFFAVMVYVVSGLITGFAHSPMSFTAQSVLTNAVLVAATLAGTELSRGWLVGEVGRKHPFAAVALCGLIYTLLSVPLSALTGLGLDMNTITYLNETFLPLLAENLLASQLALLGGAFASLAFRGPLQLFWWFCPVLPDLPWALKGIIGVSLPVALMVIIGAFYETYFDRHRGRVRSAVGSQVGLLFTALISVAVIWFSAGLLPVKPTVILSGSMRPVFDVGDIVLTTAVEPGALNPGDIIRFISPGGGVPTVHRLLEIQNNNGQMVFVTKGDANDAPDPDGTSPGAVTGRVVYSIPKVGWLSIFIKSVLIGGGERSG